MGLYYHNIFPFVKSTKIINVVQITSYFEFLLIKPIFFIELTQIFNFKELNISMRLTYFFMLNQQYFCTVTLVYGPILTIN